MGNLTIRKLPDDIHQDLRERAARNGRSLEAEARFTLINSVRPAPVKPRKNMFEIIYEASRPGFDLPIPKRSPARIPRIDEE